MPRKTLYARNLKGQVREMPDTRENRLFCASNCIKWCRFWNDRRNRKYVAYYLEMAAEHRRAIMAH